MTSIAELGIYLDPNQYSRAFSFFYPDIDSSRLTEVWADLRRRAFSAMLNGERRTMIPADIGNVDQTILNTAALLREPKVVRVQKWEIVAYPEQTWETEGLVTVDLSMNGIRLADVGMTVHQGGELIIGRSQRHKLGDAYRKRSALLEKQQGDQLIRDLERKYGITIEGIALFSAILYALSKQNITNVLLPELSSVRSVRLLTDEWQRQLTQYERDIQQFLPFYENEFLEGRLKDPFLLRTLRLIRHTSFGQMLRSIGLDPESCEKVSVFGSRYFSIPPKRILYCLEHSLTDDECYPDRREIRLLFHGLAYPPNHM